MTFRKFTIRYKSISTINMEQENLDVNDIISIHEDRLKDFTIEYKEYKLSDYFRYIGKNDYPNLYLLLENCFYRGLNQSYLNMYNLYIHYLLFQLSLYLHLITIKHHQIKSH